MGRICCFDWGVFVLGTIEQVKDILWSSWYTNGLSDDDYSRYKQEMIEGFNSTNDPEYLFVLSELDVHWMNHKRREIIPTLVDGLKLDDEHSGLHDNLVVAMSGIQADFKKQNKYKLIDFYYRFIDEHPNSLIARRILIENLISNYRFTEAEVQIDYALPLAKDKSFYLLIHIGEIKYMSGNHDEAFSIWNDIIQKFPDDFRCVFAIADLYASFALYDRAIDLYKKSFELQAAPRKIDSLQSLVQIYEIEKDFGNALNITHLILKVYEEDYNLIDGEEVQIYRDDKLRFESLQL